MSDTSPCYPTAERLSASDHAIIPRPSRIDVSLGEFELSAATVISADDLSAEHARYLSAMLAPATGMDLCVRVGGAVPAANVIVLRIDADHASLGDEGYRLEVQAERILIHAHHPAGVFYACQTLRQLLPVAIFSETVVPQQRWTVPCVTVTDVPRFPWRGVMLDVARHFHTKQFLMRYIDLLACYKMNRLHLHLTDSQAWTLEITQYPLLTPRIDEPGHGSPARGTYSQQEMREIVAYAAARHVMIIPEIEFPSHSDAVLLNYPDLLCVNHASRTDGHDHREYCPGRDDVYQVIDEILAEVAALFPAPYLHIGGDEYFGTAWEQCPDCRQRIESAHLDAEDSDELRRLFAHCQGSPRKYLLYRYMMRRVAAMVVAKGKMPVLWDDLSWRGNFPPQSVIMQWHYRGLQDWMQQTTTPENPALEAAHAGHAAVVAPASHLYFDYFDGAALLQRLYEFEPAPVELPAEHLDRIWGPHACMWEHPQEQVDAMLFPRLIVLAELGWTAKALRRWEDFQPRLRQHLPRLDLLGVHYACMPDEEQLPRQRQVFQWDLPRLSHGAREWWTNEVMTDNGTYALTLSLSPGSEATRIVRVSLKQDGRELAADLLQRVEPNSAGDVVYHCTIPDYQRDALYAIRVDFEGDGQQDSRGKLTVTRRPQR